MPDPQRVAAKSLGAVDRPAPAVVSPSATGRPSAKPAAAKPELTDAQLLATLDQDIDCGEPSDAYFWGIIFISATLVLLPLSYCALIFFVTWLTVRGVMQAEAGSATLAGMSALLGAIVVVFLVKPLFFFRRQTSPDVQVLEPSSEPLLFEFVHKLCAALGAPAPKQIEVDCKANASASFRSGLASMFGDDMVLRIGLPLAAGLTVRQFAGVLAHELGHFSQRGGMRGTYVVRLTNVWFARIVFHRDRLDRFLAGLKRTRSARILIFYYTIAWMVESARGLMWLLMIVGELLSNWVMRRMEFDADRYEAHIAGARDFQGTARILTLLNVATAGARHDLQRSWETQRLADDFPRLIVAKARELPPALRKAVFKAIDERKTRWFESHPCDTERFEHVRSLETTPMVRCDLPAKRLFSNFGALCRQASELEYRSVLKEKFDPASLVPTARLVAERAGERQAFEALQRFYQGHVIASRPILPEPNSWEGAGASASVKASLQQSREKMVEAAETLGDAAAKYEQRAMQLAIARGKIALAGAVKANRKIGVFRRGAEAEAQKLTAQQNAAVLSMIDFEDSARARLTAGLRLVQSPDIARQLIAAGCAQPIQRAEKLCRVLDALTSSISQVNSVRTFSLMLRVMLAAHNPRQPHHGIAQRLVSTTRELNVLVRQIRDDLSGVAYPFEHAIAGVSVGRSLVDDAPAADAIVPTLLSAESLAERFFTLLYRSLAGATELSERVESALGMAALADPKSPEADSAAAAAADSRAARKQTRSYWIWYSARAASGLTMLGGLIWLAGGGTFALPQSDGRQPSWAMHDAARPSAPPPAVPAYVAIPTTPTPSQADAVDQMMKENADRVNAIVRQMQQNRSVSPGLPAAPGIHPAPATPPPPASNMPSPAAVNLPAPQAAAPAAPTPSPLLLSQKKMRAVQRAIFLWQAKHGRQYPDALGQLVDEGLLPDLHALQSPGNPSVEFGYIKPRTDSPRTAILLYDPAGYDNRPGPAILVRGSVLSLPTDDAMKARIAEDSGRR